MTKNHLTTDRRRQSGTRKPFRFGDSAEPEIMRRNYRLVRAADKQRPFWCYWFSASAYGGGGDATSSRTRRDIGRLRNWGWHTGGDELKRFEAKRPEGSTR